MRILITSPAGVSRDISDTRWSALQDVLDTLASAAGGGAEEAILDWCSFGGPDRPAIDDVRTEEGVLTLYEYDPDADMAAGEAFLEAVESRAD